MYMSIGKYIHIYTYIYILYIYEMCWWEMCWEILTENYSVKKWEICWETCWEIFTQNSDCVGI